MPNQAGWRPLTNHPRHDSSNVISEFEHVRDTRGIQKFVGDFLLSDNHGRVDSSNSDRGCGALIDGLERIFWSRYEQKAN